MTQAPNRAPDFVKPKARVTLQWPAGVLERFPTGTNTVGSPPAPLRWLLVEPADFALKVSSTTERHGDEVHGRFQLSARLPPEGLPDALPAVGTAFLVHGYGVDLETLFPWGLFLAEAGWRCVLVDLRGHGRSGGRRFAFGIWETNDLAHLRVQLEAEGRVRGPYVAVGHSLGASIAMRWQSIDPAIEATVAFGALAEFAPAVARLRSEYASWVPASWVRRATQRLPGILGVTPEALDTTGALQDRRVRGMLVAGAGDAITPPEDSAVLRPYLAAGSEFLIVGPVTHETLPYHFDQHGRRVREWLRQFAE